MTSNLVRHNRHVSRPGRAIFNRTGMYIYLVLKQSRDHHYLIILNILWSSTPWKGYLTITRGKKYPDKISFLMHSLGIAPPRVDEYERTPSAVVHPTEIAPSVGRNQRVLQERERTNARLHERTTCRGARQCDWRNERMKKLIMDYAAPSNIT